MLEEHRAATLNRSTDCDERAMDMQGEFTPAQRDRLIMAAMDTQAMEGIAVPYDLAVAAFESALRKPLPDIG
jgi:hypothetical protein